MTKDNIFAFRSTKFNISMMYVDKYFYFIEKLNRSIKQIFGIKSDVQLLQCTLIEYNG